MYSQALFDDLVKRVIALEHRTPPLPVLPKDVGVAVTYDKIMNVDQFLVIMSFLNQGQLINAIKEMRERFPSMTLKESKELCEAIRGKMVFTLAKSFSA